MTDALTTRACELLAEQNAPAIVARLESHEDVIWEFARDANGAEIDPNISFPIYSVTKTYIAALIGKHLEEQKTSFDTPLANLLPEIVIEGANTISLRNLLRHDSGIRDYGGLTSYQNEVKNRPSSPWGEERFFQETLPAGLAFVPGAGWGYSNINYLLLKKIVEKCHGKDFSTIVRAELVEPLVLPNTKVLDSLSDSSDLLAGYSEYFSSGKGEKVKDVRGVYHPHWVAHGLISSNVKDVNRFYQSLFQGSVVGREVLESMQAGVKVPHKHPYFKAPSYACGMMCDPDYPLGPIYGHNGQGPGYAVSSFILPYRGISFTVCCNSDKASSEKVLFDLLECWGCFDS